MSGDTSEAIASVCWMSELGMTNSEMVEDWNSVSGVDPVATTLISALKDAEA
jgi:hypothetical protein